MTVPDNSSTCILVVDDNGQNRQLAEAQLVGAGYSVTLAESGEQALELFAQHTPDLVLLDVMMPGIDGFETARRIRASRRGTDIAIVFLTALTDMGSHQQALEAGGDDFLTKPINRTELLMRVRSLLWVQRLKTELRERYDLIRTQRDALLRVQRQKEDIMALMVHDLKNPLSGILANVQFIVSAEDEVPLDFREAAADAQQAAESIHRMVLNLLDISCSEDGALQPKWEDLDLRELMDELITAEERRAAVNEQHLEFVASDVPGELRADRDLVRRLIENLLDNAQKYSPPGGIIRVELRASDGALELCVADQGPGVPEEQRERIFDKYARLEGVSSTTARASRGLGLTFCRMAAEIHGGRIWIESAGDVGSVFHVLLPRAPPPAPGA